MYTVRRHVTWRHVSYFIIYRFAERTENKIQQMFRDELGSGGMELMLALLTLDPKRRISVHDARKHKYDLAILLYMALSSVTNSM